MFGWAITFLVIAIIAAALGFGGLAGTAAWAAKIVFIVGLVLFVLSLIFGRRETDKKLALILMISYPFNGGYHDFF